MIDTPGFPDAYKAEALAGIRFLDELRNEKDLEWTFLSPSAEFIPGERTGKFRLGADQLLTNSHGRSWISMEDFAIAMVDEMEQPKHLRQRSRLDIDWSSRRNSFTSRNETSTALFLLSAGQIAPEAWRPSLY